MIAERDRAALTHRLHGVPEPPICMSGQLVRWPGEAGQIWSFCATAFRATFASTHAHGKLVAAGQSLKPGTARAGSRVSLTLRQAQMPKHRVRRGPCSEPGAEVRAWHGREHLLLVVDRPAAVGGHIGWIVG